MITERPAKLKVIDRTSWHAREEIAQITQLCCGKLEVIAQRPAKLEEVGQGAGTLEVIAQRPAPTSGKLTSLAQLTAQR